MRKIWKGLKFLLCYLAITVATAAGVVVVSTNNAGNINGNNSGGSTNITQEENNLMEVVTNVMELNSFNLTSDITLTKGSQSIALNLDLDINLASNLNNIAAQGNISAIYNNEEYKLDLTFVDKTVYMSALDQDLTFTVDGISQGISEALKLVSVKLPDIGASLGGESAGFDPTMLLSKMGEYTEKKSGDTITITLEFMDWDITMVCDESYNLMSVDIPNINLEGFDIALKANLTEHTQKPEISKPTKQYLNLDILTNLLPYANEIKNNGYLAADLKATYQNTIIDMNLQTDFSASPIIKLTSPIFEGISLMYQDKALYTSLGNINLKTTTKDLQDLFSFIKNDMKANLNNLSPEIVNTISKSAQSATTALVNSAKELSLDDMLEYLDYLSVNEDKITYALDNLYAEMNIIDNKITSIYVRYDNFEFEVYNISTTKQDITLDTNEYLLFEDVFPTLRNFVNTIFKKGISGNLNIIDGSKTLSLNYGIRYTDTLETSFDTKLFNKTISLVTKNDTIFVAVDGIKLTAALGEYQEILDYINKTFGINAEVNLQAPELDLPQVSNIDLNNISLDFIQAINVIPGGIEIVINNNLTIKVKSTNDYISNICVYVNDMIVDLNITDCGDIKLFEIRERDYLHFEDVKRYIDTFIDFSQEQAYNLDLTFAATLADQKIDATINGKLARTGKADLDINASLDNNAFDINIFATGKEVGVSYNGLTLYTQNNPLNKVIDIIKNVLPEYIDINQVLTDNGINLDKAQNNIKNKLNTTTIDYKNIIYSISKIDLAKRSITLAIDTTKYFDEAIRLNITITMINGGYNLFVVGVYEDNSILISANITPDRDFEVALPTPAIDIEDYLDFVETTHNTISSRNLKLGITANYDNHTANADVLVDFRKALKAQLHSESLGSELDITYIDQNNIFVKLGNIKLACKVSEFEDLLNYVKGDLNDILQSYGINAIQKLISSANGTTEVSVPEITFEDIKDILYTIDFADDKITFVKDCISITLNKTNNRFASVAFTYENISVVITIEDNTQTITKPTDYTSFGNVSHALKAVAQSLSSHMLGADVTLQLFGDTYTGNIKLGYINDVVMFSATTGVYGQDINITVIDSTVYVKINELYVKVDWAERHELFGYINEKFGLNIDIDNLISNSLPKAEAKAFSLQDINVSFIKTLTATNNSIHINDNLAEVYFGTYKDSTKDYISSIDLNVSGTIVNLYNMIYGNDALITLPTDESNYATYKTFTEYFDEVQRLINAASDDTANQYKLSGSAKLYKVDNAGNAVSINGVADELNITFNELKFDATKNTFMGGLDATGSGSLYTDYLGGYDHSFDAAYDYNFIYFDYNGLRVKFSKQSNSEFISVLQTALPNYLGDSKLTTQIMDILGMVTFDEEGNMQFKSMGTFDIFDMVEDFAPMLSTLRLEEDNSLTIGIDVSKFVKSMKDELLINVRLDQNNKLSLHISKFKIAKDLAIDFNIYVDTTDAFLVAPEGSFMDMTSIGKLLGDFDNTAQSTTEDNQTYKLNFSGYIHIKLKVLFINIDKDIPFTAQLVLDTKSDSLVEGKFVVNMPSIPLMTDGGTSTLYLTDRLEGVPILYINRTGSDPLKSKYKTSELGDNLIHVISDITGMSADTLETFMTMDIKYIDGPSKAENILKAYSCTTTNNSRKYTIGLDLRQLTLMDMMVGYSETNKTNLVLTSEDDVFTAIGFNNITLEAISGVYIYAYGGIDLSNLTQDFDFVPEIEDLDPTAFGGWNDGSLIAYFEENGGSTVPNQMGSTGRNIKLRVPTKEIVNGNKLEVYRFLGWSLNADGSGTLYNDTYLFGTESLTFYAVWELDTVYTEHTITFATEVGTTPDSITTYNGYDITNSLPTFDNTMTIYHESVGVSITYRYDGLFLNRVYNENDGTYTYSEPFNSTVMGEADQIVYVCWTEIDRVYTRKLIIYDSASSDNLTVKYEGYFAEGSEIDILSLVAHNETTRWYDTYENNVYSDLIAKEDLPTVMPTGSDLTLHIQNYYTMTFKSQYGSYDTTTISGYQGEALNAPELSDYEQTFYKDGSTTIPNYLRSYDYQGYFLNGSNYKTAMPDTIPNKATTYVAKWNVFDTSYIKLTFDTGWTRANYWINDGTQKTAPGKVDTSANGFTNEGTADNVIYVLAGSTLNGITLTRKFSALGLIADKTYQLKATCKYAYKISIFSKDYDFKAVNYNTTGKKNYNTDSYSTTNHGELTQDTTFYVEWKSGSY